jgi:light-regulated signal transduction histidine kinase (bacteriophytochrome)
MVASYTELLQEKYEGKLDQKADKYIGYAVEGAKRMQQLINDLLLLSRVNTRGKPFQPTDCNELLEKVLRGLGSTIDDQNARIELSPLPVVTGDDVQLFQLFQNLISNAIKFHGAEKPVVKVSAKLNDTKWIFAVQDNGIGIDPQFFDRIFVIFQRLHGRGAYHGTGIGLAVSKRIVERHGGKIWVESDPGKGSTFYFSLKDKATA